jgi:hypothetical protein
MHMADNNRKNATKIKRPNIHTSIKKKITKFKSKRYKKKNTKYRYKSKNKQHQHQIKSAREKIEAEMDNPQSTLIPEIQASAKAHKDLNRDQKPLSGEKQAEFASAQREPLDAEFVRKILPEDRVPITKDMVQKLMDNKEIPMDKDVLESVMSFMDVPVDVEAVGKGMDPHMRDRMLRGGWWCAFCV